jgi:hypothetical protein
VTFSASKKLQCNSLRVVRMNVATNFDAVHYTAKWFRILYLLLSLLAEDWVTGA